MPAVLYGSGIDPQHITLPGHDLALALKNSNALLSIAVGSDTHLAIPKQVQRDPLTRHIEHADLLLVKKGQKVTVDIRVHLVGEAAPDALVVTENSTISVEAEATHIPENVEVSIEGLEVGSQIHASDLDLPAGSTLAIPEEWLIVNIVAAPTAEEVEAELEEAEAEAGIEHDVSDEDRRRSRRGRLRRRRVGRGRVRRWGLRGGVTWLVVGLGNPGPTYASTRHNVGYLVTDVLAARMGGSFKAHTSRRADVVEGRLAGERAVLGRSRSYMNDSGGAVSTLAKYYDTEPDHLIVVQDELDLPFGSLRVKLGGGDNGHNGLRDIRRALGTGDYFRVRLGIGRPGGRAGVTDHVLKTFSSAERKDLAVHVEEAADAVESLMTRGLEATQSAFNR